MIEEPLGPYERKLLLLNKGREIFHKVEESPVEITGGAELKSLWASVDLALADMLS
jgi:hypothetical protein